MTDTTQTRDNESAIVNEFENIIPWNGMNDTGRDVRLKWERNFARVTSNFSIIIEELKNCLRKDRPDSTNFLLSLLGGAKIGKNLTFGEFITNVSGGMIDEKGIAELESLFLRSELIVPAIRYNFMTYFMGYNIISPGGGLKVKDFTDNGDGTWTVVPDLDEGIPCGQYVDDILTGFWYDKNADTRDFNAVKRIAVGYMKLLFPHWTSVSDINKDDFDTYCLQPAIRRRGIIKEQCHYIDPEFKTAMPHFWIKEESDVSPTSSNNMGVKENQLF